MATITIVIPVFNVEPYLERCLDSVINQTYSDFDVILINDGSTDNSANICQRYTRIDSRFNYQCQEYQGVSGARNSGLQWALKHSDSVWLTFVDSDDWIHPLYLEAMMDAQRDTKKELVVVDFERTQEKSPIVDTAHLRATIEEIEDYYCKDYTHFITLWGKLYRKRVFQDIRFPYGRIHEDEYVTWKIMFMYSEVAVLNEPLYAYFRNPKGIMGSSWSLGRLDSLNAFEERLLFFNKVKKYPNARNALIKHYQWHLVDSIKQVKERYPNNKKLNSALLKRLRRFLREADYSIYDHEGLYEIAYPQTYKFRWGIAVRIKKKG